MSTPREHVNNLLSVLGEAAASLATFVRLSMHSVAESVRQNMDRHEQERPHAKRNERPEEASGRNQRCRDDWQDRDRQDRQWNGGSVCTCEDAHIRTEDGDREKGGFRTVGVMAARIDSAAKYICDKSGWTVSNLQLQKLLYLSQMIHLGRHGGKRLFEGSFQAWDYGPVEPKIYHKAKAYGSSPLPDIFYDALTFSDADPRRKTLNDVCDRFLDFTPGELVDITHWPKGAWAAHYVPKARSIVIPDEAIMAEYHERNRN